MLTISPEREKELFEELKNAFKPSNKNIIDDSVPHRIPVKQSVYDKIQKAEAFEDLHRIILNTFPYSSNEYYAYSYAIERYNRSHYNNDYVLAVKRPSVYPHALFDEFLQRERSIEFITYQLFPQFRSRIDIEYNPQYIQICVGVLLTTYKLDSQEPYFVLLRSNQYPTKDKFTLVQGHCDFDGTSLLNGVLRSVNNDMRETGSVDYDAMRYCADDATPNYLEYSYQLDSFLRENAYREFLEETSLDPKTCHFRWLTNKNSNILILPESHNMDSISYYHMGVVYKAEVACEESDFNNIAEKEKHSIVLMSRSEVYQLLDSHPEKFDEWLRKVLYKIR